MKLTITIESPSDDNDPILVNDILSGGLIGITGCELVGNVLSKNYKRNWALLGEVSFGLLDIIKEINSRLKTEFTESKNQSHSSEHSS